MSHFSYLHKMWCLLNLVLENWKYLFWIVILDGGLKVHKLLIHTLVMLPPGSHIVRIFQNVDLSKMAP